MRSEKLSDVFGDVVAAKAHAHGEAGRLFGAVNATLANLFGHFGVSIERSGLPQPKADYLQEAYRLGIPAKQIELGIYAGDRDQLIAVIRDHDLADRGLLPARVSYDVPVQGFGVIVTIGHKAALFPTGYLHADPVDAAALYAVRQVDAHLRFLPDEVRARLLPKL